MKSLTRQSFAITVLITLTTQTVWAHDQVEYAKEAAKPKANEAQKTHLSAMSENEMEVETDHGHTQDDTEEKSPHTHGDDESLLKNNMLYIERKLVTTPQSVIPTQPIMPPVSPSKP